MRYHVSVLLTAVLAACGQAPEQSSFSKRDVRDNAIVSGVAAPDAILNVGTITFRSSPDDPWVWGGCSGTLVAKNVFVTAGHCLFGGEEAEAAGIQFGVTFAPRTRPIPPDAPVFAGKVHVHPDFVVPTDPLELGLDPDVAVVVLDSPATHVHPAELPPADLFSKDTHEFANRTFGIAGYGRTNFAIFDGGVRRYSTMKFGTLHPAKVVFDRNPGTACANDSGGPVFELDDDDDVLGSPPRNVHKLFGITQGLTEADGQDGKLVSCLGPVVFVRLDVPLVRDFLRTFVRD